MDSIETIFCLIDDIIKKVSKAQKVKNRKLLMSLLLNIKDTLLQ